MVRKLRFNMLATHNIVDPMTYRFGNLQIRWFMNIIDQMVSGYSMIHEYCRSLNAERRARNVVSGRGNINIIDPMIYKYCWSTDVQISPISSLHNIISLKITRVPLYQQQRILSSINIAMPQQRMRPCIRLGSSQWALWFESEGLFH